MVVNFCPACSLSILSTDQLNIVSCYFSAELSHGHIIGVRIMRV